MALRSSTGGLLCGGSEPGQMMRVGRGCRPLGADGPCVALADVELGAQGLDLGLLRGEDVEDLAQQQGGVYPWDGGPAAQGVHVAPGSFEGAHGRTQARPKRSEERRVGKECRSRWSPYH